MNDKFSIIYDGIDLADIVDGFTRIDRSIGSGWKNTVQEKLNGVDFLYNGIGPKKISIDFHFYGEARDAAIIRRKLAQFLYKSEPCPLTYSDEPNTQYWAIPDGDQSFTLDFAKGEGTINFLVPSGVSESVDTKVLNDESSGGAYGSIVHNDDNSITLKIKNEGTIETYPQIKITHKSNNGYIGIVSSESVVQLGSIDEILISNKTATNKNTGGGEAMNIMNPYIALYIWTRVA